MWVKTKKNNIFFIFKSNFIKSKQFDCNWKKSEIFGFKIVSDENDEMTQQIIATNVKKIVRSFNCFALIKSSSSRKTLQKQKNKVSFILFLEVKYFYQIKKFEEW